MNATVKPFEVTAAPSTTAFASSRPAPVPVSIKGVSKRYGATRALSPLDLEVKPGELIALLGPSGCGKTTTLRILAGFIAPDTGEVLIGGRDVTGLAPSRRSLGMVFQAYSLFPHMTVGENVAFGLKMHGVAAPERKKRVQQILETVHLTAFIDRMPAQMSGGQQQRVALARALVTNPALLLLDEPMAALDKNLRERMQFEIRDTQRRLGITTVLVTHDQEEALTMSDRVAVMCDGELVQIGAPDEIYARPRNRFVSEFLGTSNLFEGTVQARDGIDGAVIELQANGIRVAGSLPDSVAPPAIGSKVLLAVRPEKLRLLQRGTATGHNQIAATLRARIFRGVYTVCELDVPGHSGACVAYVQAVDSRLTVGSAVDISWDDADAIALAS
ncbi:ABC transporter ATP-binding protein [soil metagenome]